MRYQSFPTFNHTITNVLLMLIQIHDMTWVQMHIHFEIDLRYLHIEQWFHFVLFGFSKVFVVQGMRNVDYFVWVVVMSS